VDVVVGDEVATLVERSAVDASLGAPDSGWRGGARAPRDLHVARGGAALRAYRHRLLPALHAVNDRVGWISPGAVNYLAQRLDVAPAEVFGVASFYGLFATEERTGRQVHVCVDLACMGFDGHHGDQLPAGAHPSPCLGLCDRAPAMMVVDPGESPRACVVAPASPVQVRTALDGGSVSLEAPPMTAVPQAGAAELSLLRRVGVVNPASLDSYLAHGGFGAFIRATSMGPAAVIADVTASGLSGRGGAAFPTGRKWAAVAGQPVTERYLVVNADESEPGTFKDRVVMENDPFAVIESAMIAMYATGCQQGYIYLRGEYPRARRMLASAIAQCYDRGLLGPRSDGLRLDIELFLGAGAYICGEETAIFNSIEGHRGEPRNKPPFPVEVGLFGKPTVVNNVETLINVLPILELGVDAYCAQGIGDSPGTKLFCVSGAVGRPGVYEVPFGVTLRDVIDLAGGLRAGSALRAVLLGGAAGGFATVHDLDVALTIEATRTAGLTLGSGVVMVLDESVDCEAFVLRIAEFFREESCGQCVPCRVGTVRQEETLVRLGRRATDADRTLLTDIGAVMRDASICGLGQTAFNAVESARAKLGVFG
jgi:NADH-quinone oxidoreductase subunit F